MISEVISIGTMLFKCPVLTYAALHYEIDVIPVLLYVIYSVRSGKWKNKFLLEIFLSLQKREICSIEFSASADRNVSRKEREKRTKYQEFF